MAGAPLAMRLRMQLSTRWSVSGWLASTTLATIAFWSIFGACVDTSNVASSGGPQARAIIAWDPRMCGDPHRVIVELEDPGGGEPVAASVPCAIGAVTIDVPRFGLYEGRAYAWTASSTVRSQSPLVLTLDAPVTHWQIVTPE